MTSFINGIHAVDMLKWRSWNGIVADLWHAEGCRGGNGYYVSPDPRIVVFLDDGMNAVDLSGTPDFREPVRAARIAYIPAGMPLWSRIRATGTFRHLDLHFDARRLGDILRIAGQGARLSHPLLLEDNPSAMAIARLIAEECRAPARHDLFGESLITALLVEIFALTPGGEDLRGALSPAQLRRVTDFVDGNLDRRVPVQALARVAGLSESRFSHAFKQATGMPPDRWQMTRRIAYATKLLVSSDLPLAQVALQTGFADQAHLTRSFRNITGKTPAVCRRETGLLAR